MDSAYHVDEVVCAVLVSLLDDRGGPLALQNGAVVERATGRRLTMSEVADMVELVMERLAALESYD